jgi:hypothetical protein
MRHSLIFLLLLSFFTSCEEPYSPTIEVEDMEPVVIIDAFINTDGQSQVRVSQTVPIGTDSSALPIINAEITVLSDNGYSYTYSGNNPKGEYTLPHGPLTLSAKYRLLVKVLGREYTSQWVTPLATGNIDQVELDRTDLGMEVLVSSQNTESPQRFYRWQVEETWQMTSRNISLFMYENGEVRRRSPEENISRCFQFNRGTDIAIATTENLDKNEIVKQKIQFIPNLSNKLGIRYSVLVKQYNISKESYLFWSVLKKNSESVGDLFGSMPAELKGNFQQAEGKPVLGWLDAGKPSTRREYFAATALTPVWQFNYPGYEGCTTDEITVQGADELFRRNTSLVPLHELFKIEGNPDPSHYAYSSKLCADCSRYGSTTTPEYWNENY